MQIKATYENIENLRQLLDNLIILSFNQENLIYETKEVNQNDPVFITLMEKKKNILDPDDNSYCVASFPKCNSHYW